MKFLIDQQLAELEMEGVTDAATKTDNIYGYMDNWCKNVTALGPEEFSSAEEFMHLFNQALSKKISEAVGA